MVRGGAGGQGAMETLTGKAGTNYADDATADKLLQNESMVDFLARNTKGRFFCVPVTGG